MPAIERDQSNGWVGGGNTIWSAKSVAESDKLSMSIACKRQPFLFSNSKWNNSILSTASLPSSENGIFLNSNQSVTDSSVRVVSWCDQIFCSWIACCVVDKTHSFEIVHYFCSESQSLTEILYLAYYVRHKAHAVPNHPLFLFGSSEMGGKHSRFINRSTEYTQILWEWNLPLRTMRNTYQ